MPGEDRSRARAGEGPDRSLLPRPPARDVPPAARLRHVPGRLCVAGAVRKSRCLLVVSHPDRGLSRALLQHLAAEVSRVEFTLSGPALPDGTEPYDTIWICGHDAGTLTRISVLRGVFPEAVILATRREQLPGWERAAHAAGADYALPWPLSQDQLLGILTGGGGAQTACHG